MRLDIDYWHELTPEERAWLDQFCCEFYYCNFNNNHVKAGKPTLHDESYRKALYNFKNARERDIWNVSTEKILESLKKSRATGYSPLDYVRNCKDEINDLTIR